MILGDNVKPVNFYTENPDFNVDFSKLFLEIASLPSLATENFAKKVI